MLIRNSSASGRSKLAILENCWQCVADRQRGELFAVAGEECIAANYEPARPQFDKFCEDSVEVTVRCGRSGHVAPALRCGRPTAPRALVVSAMAGTSGLTRRAMTLL